MNASPDLGRQIACSPFLHPAPGGRASPIAGVVLTGGEIDAVAGLLALRERHPLTIRATRAVLELLAANPIFDALAARVVRRIAVPLDLEFDLADIDGTSAGLTCCLFPVPGKLPLYLEGGGLPGELEALTVAAEFAQGGRRLLFIPGCAAITPSLRDRLAGADCLLFDGTFFTDDEMIRQATGSKTGQRMGHISVDGPIGAIAGLADVTVGQRIFIHINNTNPMLLEDSPEHRAVLDSGWRVAWDGMEIVL